MSERRAGRPVASAIVLAGGRSRRFGADKLSSVVAGRTLLEAAVAGVLAVASDVVVVLAPGDDRSVPGDPSPGDPSPGSAVRIARDSERFGGPLVGMLAGLEAVDQPLAVVTGGDMPYLRSEVLELMLRTLVTTDQAFGAVVLERRGRIEPLPAVLRTGLATDHVRRLVADGERSLRGLFERLPTRVIAEAAWRPLDPDAETLRDVDRPSDLGS